MCRREPAREGGVRLVQQRDGRRRQGAGEAPHAAGDRPLPHSGVLPHEPLTLTIPVWLLDDAAAASDSILAMHEHC